MAIFAYNRGYNIFLKVARTVWPPFKMDKEFLWSLEYQEQILYYNSKKYIMLFLNSNKTLGTTQYSMYSEKVVPKPEFQFLNDYVLIIWIHAI